MSLENQVKRAKLDDNNHGTYGFIRKYRIGAPIRTIVASTSAVIPNVSFVD